MHTCWCVNNCVCLHTGPAEAQRALVSGSPTWPEPRAGGRRGWGGRDQAVLKFCFGPRKGQEAMALCRNSNTLIATATLGTQASEDTGVWPMDPHGHPETGVPIAPFPETR